MVIDGTFQMPDSGADLQGSPPVFSEGCIGLFDSGLGGFSILREVRQLLPSADILYVADNASVPYGNKPEAFIRDRARILTQFLLDHGARGILIACNTATALSADSLRETFSIPIIAVEPAVKPAVRESRTKTIAVLATARTLACQRFDRLIHQFADGCRVLTDPCDGWVGLVEKGDFDTPETERVVRRTLDPMLAEGADVFVLGCTHYPFLIPVIERVVAGRAVILNPAPAVARQLVRQLDRTGFSGGGGRTILVTTGAPYSETIIRTL